jgi:octaheme c-type cytochrome (tetrathionate reductase family)
LNLLEIAQNVGSPTRANCGTCHWFGGGGDAVKHGDLDLAMKHPPMSHDVHMGGQDFPCQECHVTKGHKIAGSSTTSAVSEGKVACIDCHDERPHPDTHPLLKKLNSHCESIACQACHIPTFATAQATLMFWDWSKAGKDQKKGLMVKRKNLRPTYAWYNGKHRRYLAGDPANMKGVTYLNPPVGDISDPGARITPYKIHAAIQPADAVYGYLIVPKLWGGFWNHYDWQKAAAQGMEAAGLKFSGNIEFVNTAMHWRINHGVVPKEQALSCTDCHRPDGVMDFTSLGYRGDPATTGGRRKT